MSKEQFKISRAYWAVNTHLLDKTFHGDKEVYDKIFFLECKIEALDRLQILNKTGDKDMFATTMYCITEAGIRTELAKLEEEYIKADEEDLESLFKDLGI